MITLTRDDEILVHLEREGRIVTKFSVQYRARIRGEWRPVVRFDTAHGRAQRHFPSDGTQETQELNASLGYLVDSFGELLLPHYNLTIAMFTFIGEVVLILWLLWKGIKGFDKNPETKG